MSSPPSAPTLVDTDNGTAQAAAEPVTARPPAARFSDALNRVKKSEAWVPAVAILATGAVIATGGAIWAVLAGVTFPLAIMAAYCTLAGSVCVATALVYLLTPEQKMQPPPVAGKPTPNYTAWKLVKSYSVSNASRLWCDIEPGSALTQDSIAWAKVLLGAISRGELPMVEKPGVAKDVIERERKNPNWHTEVAKDALQAWAKTHGFTPRFLQD